MEEHFKIFILCDEVFVDGDSSSDDEVLEEICGVVGSLSRQNIERKYSFVREIETHYSDEEFRCNFRLTRKAFNWTYNNIRSILEDSKFKPNISPVKQLLAAVWVLSTPDSYRSIAGRFNMAKSSLHSCFVRVVKALNNISHKVITWPTAEEREIIQQSFYGLGQIPGCVGAIDGTYIPIKAPIESPEVYVNRKCFYAIILQAICDNNRKFIDIFCGYPSSVSDNRIFRNSNIYKNIIRQRGIYFSENQFIVGDKAYPLYDWCVTPFIDRGNLEDYQISFNKRHAQTRQVIERSFALLFGRFRRLKYLDMTKTDFIPETVQSACILHNICLMHNDDLQQYEVEGFQFFRNQNHADEMHEVVLIGSGTEFRNRLARQ